MGEGRGEGAIAEVTDTQKPLEGFHVHQVQTKAPLKVGDNFRLVIDEQRRDRIRANHSATHILHAVLRRQLGEHITQKGSLVAPDRLRFDISHPAGLLREEIESVEREVNRVIGQNAPVATKLMTPDEAIAAGAMALFGEKYGDEVRVLSMGIGHEALGTGEQSSSPNAQSLVPNAYSVELCGGTHVHATGDIGLFKIVSEGSVASGIRRIEAVTGEGVREYAKKEFAKLNEQLQKLADERAKLLSDLNKPSVAAVHLLSLEALQKASLGNLLGFYEQETTSAQSAIAALQDENKQLGKALAEAKKQAALGDSKAEKETVGGYSFIGKTFSGLDPKELRSVAEGFLKDGAQIAVAATDMEGKASIVVAVDKAHSGKVSAVDLVKAAVEILGGKGGGGKPEMAQGGGPEAGKLPEALATIRQKLK